MTLTVVAVAALAVGIGLNTAVFSFVNGILFKGLPFEESHEIVHLNTRNLQTGDQMGISYPDLRDWRDQAGSFEGLAGFMGTQVNLSDDRRFPERLNGTRVTPNLFSVVRQPLLMGRDFAAEDGERGAQLVAIIGERLWRDRYEADPAVLGETIRANGLRFAIIGVMPLGMEFPNNSDIWFTIRDEEEFEPRDTRNLQVVGRLRDGVSLEQAQAELETVTAALANAYPATNADLGARIRTSSEFYNGGEIRVLFLAMMGAVTFVLLIACANVANLLLAQALRRTSETSIRTALGARRWRIVRQHLTESLMLSAAGTVIGTGLALAGVTAFDRATDTIQGKPYWIDFSMDYRVLGYTILISVGTALAFGLAPALQASRTDINNVLKDGGRSTSGGTRSRRWTGMLVVAELGLTLVLLAGTGLMFRSLLNLQQLDLGVETDGLMIADIMLPQVGYEETDARVTFYNRLRERLREVSGLESSLLVSNPPGTGSGFQQLTLPGRDVTDAQGRPAYVSTITTAPGYFETFSTALLRGRDFSDVDGTDGSHVAIVNQSFVQQYWPEEDPLGRSLQLGSEDDARTLRVVGVAPTIRQNIQPGQFNANPPAVLVPFLEQPPQFFRIVARGPAGPATIISGIRNAVANVDPDLPAANPTTFDERLAEFAWTFRIFSSVFAIAAVVALVLAAAGIFGVTSYAVDQRRPEIGMRVALGATPRNVLWLVMRTGLRQLTIGLTVGIVGALALTRVLSGFMIGIGTSDPITIAGVVLILGAVTTGACLLPARRATQLDPIDAIRFE